MLPSNLPRHIARHIVVNDDCWEWTAYRNRTGYGRSGAGLAHRVVFELLSGPIPEGLELDHLCRNHSCVNPAHLEPVTHAENMRRSAPAQKTHCLNGHEFSAANTYIRPSGQRDCRIWTAARQRAYKARAAA